MPSRLSESSAAMGLMLARIVGLILLLLGTFLVMRPFLVPMVWAGILAYMTWPLFVRLRNWSSRPRLSAGLFTLAVFLVVAFPIGGFLVALADEGVQIVAGVRGWIEAGAPLPSWLAENRWVGPSLETYRTRAFTGSGELASHLAGFGRAWSQHLVGVAGGIARDVLVFGITLLALFAFYIEGERITSYLRRLAPAIFPTAPTELVDHVGATVRAVVFGLVGTAIVQGALAALGFVIFGVPSPLAFGALTAVLSFVPVGPPLVWGSACAWLFLGGHTGAAIGMAIWGLLLVSSVDNVLRPLIISRSGSTAIPFLLIFFGVLGGLTAFGLLGMFVGPVLLSVAFTLLADFPRTHAPSKPG